VEGHPKILVIHADEKSKHVAGEVWHSDVSCDPEPPMGSILYMHELPPEFQCRFRWRERSIAFWDNRCVQHHAMWDYHPQRRHGHRVTVRGDKPF
jgi:alpha-ketoglutarate-dependent taurine dioxygenase